MELIFYGQLNSQSGTYGAYRDITVVICCVRRPGVSAPLEMAPKTAFGVVFITALRPFKSGATERNFIVRLITFNLLYLRLSLD